ncbi:MFS transporter [Pusillimonas sp. ANT_WB101]|uniref:MFS transporter n=1 Tax=Pusillimonas sp. ANT_WB101 TaxID=2597356 RepID=UPI0011EF00C1|nr:MFS transporter [Pusillimonas sp. ANT_WB101]KAA0911854.1 MFS transporter [Pusillimonas sp. ANT_WB101]
MTQTTPAAAQTTQQLWNKDFLLASFAFLVVMIGTTLPTSLYPLYRHQFALSEMMITVIYGVYAGGTIAALIVAGSWSDQLGRRVIMFAALAFSAASGFIFLLDLNLASLLLGRVLSGISAGLATGTATVMVIELAPDNRRGIATLIATAVNMGGLGLGPLLSGILAQYAPWPMHLVFIVHLVLIVIAVGGLLKTHETVITAKQPRLHIQRLSVPREVRKVFIPASIAGFAGFAVLGLFSAVTPAFLGGILGLTNLALIGFVVFIVFAASTLGQLALEVVPLKLALPVGCLVLAAGALLVGTAINVESLKLLILGAVLSGLGQGLAFRAGLASVAAACPTDRRAEVTSTFFIVLYIAISIPVIGVGIAANALGLRPAGTGFAIAAAVLSVIALLVLQFRKQPRL